MTKSTFEGRANLAARELLHQFSQTPDHMGNRRSGFHEGDVEAAAKVIVKWLWREPMNDIARQIENCQAGEPYGN